MATNEQIAEHLQIIGERLINMDSAMLAAMETQAQMFKLFASRVSGLSAEEDAALRTAAQQVLTRVATLKCEHTDFVGLVAKFSQL